MKRQLAVVLLLLSSFFVVNQSNAQQSIDTATGVIQPQVIEGVRSSIYTNFTASISSFRYQTYYQFLAYFNLKLTGISNDTTQLSLNTITFTVYNGTTALNSTQEIATFTAQVFKTLTVNTSTSTQLIFMGPTTKVPPVLTQFYYIYFHVDKSYLLTNGSDWNTVFSSTYLFKIPVPNSTDSFVTTSTPGYFGYTGTSELIGFAELFVVLVAPFVIGYIIIKKYKH